MTKTHHVAEYKKRIVADIVKYIKEYPIIGLVNMENLPAPQLQSMKAKLRDKVQLFMTKKRLMRIALEQVKNDKKGIEELEKYFQGMPALLFTKDSPFKLSKTLQQSKSPAPAKGGQTAPKDIIIPKGPTSFAPGPIISELSSIGIKTGVEGGKVAVKEDSIVAKKGEKIKPKAAEVLTRMGIEPMEVGLDLVAAYEDGVIYPKDILQVDEKEFMNKLSIACSGAFNLAVFIEYPTKDTISTLLSKAFNEAKALGLSQNIIDSGTIGDLLGKAERSMLSLKGSANIEVKEEKPAEEKKEEVKEEKKVEEPKPEVKPEEKKEEEKPEVKEEKPVEEKKEEPKPEVKEEKAEEKVEEKPKEEPKPEEKKEEEKPEEKHKPEVKEEIKEEEKEQKEEEVLEEEKEIIEEEKEVEEEAEEKEKKETEFEKEAEEAVKEEEEKKLEAERIEQEKELEDLEKKKVEEKPKKDIDQKVREMVEETKKFAAGEKGPTADDLLKEVGEEKKEEPKAEVKEEKPKKKKEVKKEKVPSAHDLAKKKGRDEHKEVEDLAKELVKKGSLRK